MFRPIRTDRLLIRAMTLDDAGSLWERRSHPKVAEYQNWETPYPRTEADRIVTEVVAMDGPENDEWWMAAIADPKSDEVYGDLALHLSWQGRTAEVGYTLHPDRWGQGYATEAVGGLVAWLFQGLGVTRVFGMLHPENRASAMVLERSGFLFEGHTRSSYWVGDEVSDDWIYGMTRSDWQAWRDRPRHRPHRVRLVEIHGGMFYEVFGLRTHKSQESFVAPMPKSLGQALLAPTHPDHPHTPWYRAIEADGELTGFVMIALPSDHEPEPFLWRFLVDRMHQRRGIATAALALVEDEVRALGHASWRTSWVPGKGSPEPFYLARGFVPTGEVEEGEIVARKEL